MTADKDTKPEWYQEDVKSINPDAQNLLENYSGFQADEVLPHVLSLVRPPSQPILYYTNPASEPKHSVSITIPV